MVFVLLGGILFVQAYANGSFIPDYRAENITGSGQVDVPDEILGGGPIVNTTADRPQSYRLPARTIALTFDDGPDPRWTPEVMRVLDKHQVPGTFFVLGNQVVRNPEMVRTLAANGHELGVHTFTHPHLTEIPGWQRRMEYTQTQLAIAGATGIRTNLLRFPYSSRADAFVNQDWPILQQAGELGYLSVVNDLDSRDWERQGPDGMIERTTPQGYSGAITLWHDSGGDRSQTIEALERYIPMMKERGYTFTTVSGGLNLALVDAGVTGTEAGPVAASAGERRRGQVLITAVRAADGTFALFGGLFLLVGALTIGRTVLLFVLALRHARQRRRRDFAWGPPVTEPVSVIVPAYNEKEGIAAAVRSLAAGDHPGGIEVVVVDDGSTDGTADIAAGLGLPNVRVVRKPNGGKPSALNTGVALARHDLIVMVDGDTVFEPDALRRLVQPFGDPQVGAVAGNVKVGNRRGMIAKWQHIEYVIGFNLDRRLYETLRCMPTIPGAIGAFRRAALEYAGGMTDDTLAEDTDITMALGRAGWKVVYEESARAWTEAPTSFGQLWKQRYRWSYGTMQAMWKHRRSVLDKGASGRFSRRCLAFLTLFGVLLPLTAPVIDLLAIYGLIFLNRTETALAWLAMLGLQFLTAIVAFRLDKEKLGVLWVLPLQQFVYRQLMYLVLLQSVATALTGGRLGWQKLTRTGLEQPGGPGSPRPPVPVPTGTAAVRQVRR
ncbi:Glycosyltransferase, catalytic subunit of cellulose synthase and poly-beta-1,6-N-acetylglucosamine synthase [Micromonospora phaseoli]|uniref:Glycosyltransferase, catalytic subunit of cellulose synthase and poly-beta-1,6-N-acetylglucosamine synthase n=2 Tax=Micromonospora phaseoli TaxID=1144548 RepID=A0A1H6WWB1_9ACTN|nr:bifunctional polysaccharide deacetylase/glycosyltransferase family 2 protein [Micromonospora phaseoli]PZW01840.1 cellulose synthase/poly-beta-1,6-N-acetylglucosamine synthase-like glycosyltransferase [Micromonospora phaseoli]SEJ17060.1 Glycosyltransferase, catalytic subunit of cellulose synthase and poly-beta-1,6-N-acetylglucosamine synthase [Micromonospora phaseoli]